jgi:hypothetical protein
MLLGKSSTFPNFVKTKPLTLTNTLLPITITKMKSSEVLKQMKELRDEWHRNYFQLTKEQHKQYNELRNLRYERVKELQECASA